MRDVCDNKTAKLRVLNFKPYSVTLKMNSKIARILYLDSGYQLQKTIYIEVTNDLR